jgi:flagellar biosynthesis GTPase FlhF
MKILRLIKNIILSILGIIFFTFAIAMTVFVLNYNKFGVAEINENSFLLIKEDLSNAKYKKGDLVIVKNKKISRINVGDEIFTYKLETGGAVSVNVGIIEEVFIEESAVSYENGEYYSMEFVIGTADKIIPKIGDILSLILNRWGFLFVIVLPIFFIFISQIYSLIVEIKYGDEDDEDEEDVEEEERPRKKRIIEDEEEEAERPHKKRLIEEDEEEEKPRKRRLIEEDEEEEKPRKKRVVEEDEEEERPRKKRVVEDDDEMSLLDRELEKARKEALAESDEDEDDDFDIDKLNDDIEKILSDDL